MQVNIIIGDQFFLNIGFLQFFSFSHRVSQCVTGSRERERVAAAQ